MKFLYDHFFANGSIKETMLLEGGSTFIFAQRALSKVNYDLSGKSYFEVGPKHGLHTTLIDIHEPNSITCVEAPNKFRSDKLNEQNRKWITTIKTEKFDMHYQDFNDFFSYKKYDLLFYSGVMYHNVNQIGQLKKLHELASDDGYLLFESSTTRNKDLIDKNVIEVHYPPYSEWYRNVETLIFHPSKKACKSMLNLVGWDIIEVTDEYADLANEERIAIFCKKSSPIRNRHLVEKENSEK